MRNIKGNVTYINERFSKRHQTCTTKNGSRAVESCLEVRGDAMQDPNNLRSVHPDQSVILIAEDEVLVQNIVRITLESTGYFTLTAENGEDALLLSRKYPGTIQLLLSDVRMPKMSGIELKKYIEIERPATKVLLMSGET